MSAIDTTKLTLVGQRLVAEKITLRLRTIAIARKVLHSLKDVRRQIFPTQRVAPPFGILPGYGAELDIRVSAPGSNSINVYSESTPLIGGTELETSQAQVVTLDETGDGSALVKIIAKDDRATGQAAVRIVAVLPEQSDYVAAEISEVHIAQEGTGALVYMSLLFLVAVGFTGEMLFREFPFMALMISTWLGFMLLNAPKFEEIRFEPRRLLPLRRCLKSAGLAFLGFAIWSFSMWLNIVSEPDNPRSANTDYGYILLDNITTFVASFGLAFCVFLALAPAMRPKGVAGRLIILTALIPLLFYDLSLISEGKSLLSTMANNFPYLGWGLASISLLFFCIWNRVGRWWQWALTLLLLVVCILGLLTPDSVARPLMSKSVDIPDIVGITDTFIPFGVEAPNGLATHNVEFVGIAILLMAALGSILLRLLVAPFPGWRFFRIFLFLISCLGISVIFWFLVVVSDTSIPSSYLFLGFAVPMSTIIWMLIEVFLWKWRRSKRRRPVVDSAGSEAGNTMGGTDAKA